MRSGNVVPCASSQQLTHFLFSQLVSIICPNNVIFQAQNSNHALRGGASSHPPWQLAMGAAVRCWCTLGLEPASVCVLGMVFGGTTAHATVAQPRIRQTISFLHLITQLSYCHNSLRILMYLQCSSRSTVWHHCTDAYLQLINIVVSTSKIIARVGQTKWEYRSRCI